MWIFTDCGFFSVVCKEGRPELCLRARDANDLDEFRARHCPSLSPTEENSGTDYRYRGWVGRTALSAALASVVADLSYSNFKSRVAQTQGAGRAALYGRVWSVLLALEEENNHTRAKPPAKRRPRGASRKGRSVGGGEAGDSHAGG